MGLLEYLEWCEDMKAKPVLAVFAGYALNGRHVNPGPDLTPYVQDALDEIEYVIGGEETKWGARRVQDGHPEPFPLECVEVGNEDGADRSGSYPARLAQFYAAIKAKYPQLKVISTTGGKDWLGSNFPIMSIKPDLVDEHYYASTWDMMAMASKYDDYDRSGPNVFVGEWASQDVPAPWSNAASKGPTPNQKCAVADAAFLTGLERNSDVVKMACYAPLLVNVNPGGRQWAVNLIGYDALNSYGSPSYYVQRMFSQYLGDTTVPLSFQGVPTQTHDGHTLPVLFASATRNSRSGEVFVKLVNALGTAQTVDLQIEGRRVQSRGTLTTLSGELDAMNSPEQPEKVAPVLAKITGIGQSFAQILPPYSITVLSFRSSK
jgi:alpha-N-arabinofuranosidase